MYSQVKGLCPEGEKNDLVQERKSNERILEPSVIADIDPIVKKAQEDAAWKAHGVQTSKTPYSQKIKNIHRKG